jgi:hypothetical protein
MSHLPQSTLAILAEVARTVDEKLQADGYRIAQAIRADRAFDEGWIESTLLRAVVADAVSRSGATVACLPNGGREVSVVDGCVERTFRVRKASRDGRGLKILAGSDSVFSRPAVLEPSLFPAIRPEVRERWILAFVVDDALALQEVVAARPIEFINSKPGRLRLVDEVALPIGSPPPERFEGKADDLDIPPDDETGDEDGGEEEFG